MSVKIGLVMVRFRRRVMTAPKWVALDGWNWNKARIERSHDSVPDRCEAFTSVAGDPWHQCALDKGHDGRHDYSVRIYGAYPEFGIGAPESDDSSNPEDH